VKPLRRHSNERRAEKSGSGGIPRGIPVRRIRIAQPRVFLSLLFSASLRSQAAARVIFTIPDPRAFRASSRAIPRLETPECFGFTFDARASVSIDLSRGRRYRFCPSLKFLCVKIPISEIDARRSIGTDDPHGSTRERIVEIVS